MSVDARDRPAKGLPLAGERLEVQHLFRGADALDLIVVDNGNHRVQLMMAGEQRCLPGRALVAVALRENAENIVSMSAKPMPERKSDRKPKAMPERAGAHVDCRHKIGAGDVSPQRC